MGYFAVNSICRMSVSPTLNPHVSVDCVIFGFSKETLRLLLIKRTVPNSVTDLDDSYYALPGDLVSDNENLDEAAARVLKELTGLSGIFLQQFQAFGDPLRITKAKDRAWLKGVRQDPDARVITVAYMALITATRYKYSRAVSVRKRFGCPLQRFLSWPLTTTIFRRGH